MREDLWILLKERLTESWKSAAMRDGFVLSGRGHTREANAHETTRNGRDTAAWYAVGRMLEFLDDDTAGRMLAAVESLQDVDPASSKYGCMRWYAEESRIDDTNGAFFVQMPLAVAMTLYPDRIPREEQTIILRILSRGGSWFREALTHGPIHYSNKILSDGGITLAIANLTGDAGLYEAGVRFFERWLRYTTEEGWGWGENMSTGYNLVIFAALRLAILSLGEEHRALADGLQSLVDEQCAMFRFFDGHELTPAIRNYNYQGAERLHTPVLNIAGVRGNALNTMYVHPWDLSTIVALFGDEMYLDDAELDLRGSRETLCVPRTRVTHVFRENEAYSWIGANGSLGTLNNFPVFPNCYQHKSWGLGWQCMPVNAVVYGERVFYARWVVEGDGWTRIHPRHCYLSPALFEEDPPYPAVRTRCRQKDHVAIAVRTMENVDNSALAIRDEWYIPACTADIREVSANGRIFTAVVCKNASVLLAPLSGGRIERIDDPDGAVRLSVIRASSSTGHICQRQLAGGFAIVFMDAPADDGALERFAGTIRLTEKYEVEPYFTDDITLTVGGLALSWRYDIRELSTL